jgi:hypothetical protein
MYSVAFMRTTLETPDVLFRQAKAAALRGKTLKLFLTEAIQYEVSERPRQEGGQPVQLPLVPSSRPGSKRLTSDRVAELLAQEELDAAAGR